jgi:hypothetical protein
LNPLAGYLPFHSQRVTARRPAASSCMFKEQVGGDEGELGDLPGLER